MKEYRKIDGYEVHPTDIAFAISKMRPDTINGINEDMTDLEEAIYQLDAICQNENNANFYRVLYQYLAKYTDNLLNDIALPFKV